MTIIGYLQTRCLKRVNTSSKFTQTRTIMKMDLFNLWLERVKSKLFMISKKILNTNTKKIFLEFMIVKGVKTKTQITFKNLKFSKTL